LFANKLTLDVEMVNDKFGGWCGKPSEFLLTEEVEDVEALEDDEENRRL